MPTNTHHITFKLIHLNEELFVKCTRGQFRNLMVLINEKIYVEDFGECKGIGRCGTCLVEIVSISPLPSSERNELSTLSKCAVHKSGIRLACQVMIDEGLQGAVVKVVEEREDVR